MNEYCSTTGNHYNLFTPEIIEDSDGLEKTADRLSLTSRPRPVERKNTPLGPPTVRKTKRWPKFAGSD